MNMETTHKIKPGAIFHFDCKVHGRSTGANAIRLAAYRAGERLRSELTGRIHNFTRKKEVIHRQILAPAGAPTWALDRARLWNAIDTTETRKDAQLAREVEVALPLILSPTDNLELLRAWVRETFVAAGMIADIAYHAKRGNPHAHILLTMREIGPNGFGKKNRAWNDPRLVESWRESWACFVNRYLEKAGHDIRIDHRSYRRQNIQTVPTKHTGPEFSFNAEKRESIMVENALIVSTRNHEPDNIKPLENEVKYGLAKTPEIKPRRRRPRRNSPQGISLKPTHPSPGF